VYLMFLTETTQVPMLSGYTWRRVNGASMLRLVIAGVMANNSKLLYRRLVVCYHSLITYIQL
jgi:hypothetical protein